MNDNDEPIVFDQLDALSCFIRTGAEILILNNKMLLKNKFDVEVEVNTFQLTPTEGQLIIGSAGFWEVVAPPAATLQAHLFSNVRKEKQILNFFFQVTHQRCF